MDLSEAIASLPHPYAVALRLDDAGQDATAIATALGVEGDTIPNVLRLGRQKLARLLKADDHDCWPHGSALLRPAGLQSVNNQHVVDEPQTASCTLVDVEPSLDAPRAQQPGEDLPTGQEGGPP
jgi:hypothetical protein